MARRVPLCTKVWQISWDYPGRTTIRHCLLNQQVLRATVYRPCSKATVNALQRLNLMQYCVLGHMLLYPANVLMELPNLVDHMPLRHIYFVRLCAVFPLDHILTIYYNNSFSFYHIPRVLCVVYVN